MILFQSTLPVWGATDNGLSVTASNQISIHAPRVGSDACSSHSCTLVPLISIHAPRVGSDLHKFGDEDDAAEISIHAPRVGSDAPPPGPLWPRTHFNPRSPCGERRLKHVQQAPLTGNFNPRSPCGERPTTTAAPCPGTPNFNPRSPCGERPVCGRYQRRLQQISIHAPRVGSDGSNGDLPSARAYFNPRSPCGERPSAPVLWGATAKFQSTLPVWGATTGITG